MFRIVVGTLLLLVLLDNFNDSEASSAGFHVTRGHIRRCRCRDFPNGKIKCRSRRFTQRTITNEELIKCFCSKTNQHKFPEFQAACESWHPGFPISLA